MCENHKRPQLKIEPGNNQIRHIVVDVETTGMSVQRGGRVIEVGAVALVHGEITDEFSSLINTGTAISYSAFRVHGITEQMLSGQPLPVDVWRYFREFVADTTLVAHNLCNLYYVSLIVNMIVFKYVAQYATF